MTLSQKNKAINKMRFIAFGSSNFKIVFVLLAKVIIFHMQMSIVKVRIPGLNESITKHRVYLAIFWLLTNDSKVNLVAVIARSRDVAYLLIKINLIFIFLS